ncbi:hypothetical protein [Sphingomonas nostoxanthinifaciens]|uniref:hypothetical protein n=1 Tax=Sphingomonas nostoxanthinifaciens TaxID=2872652 RepID=UPI001CC1DF36|nr:hypothetical protein [Sphingomonas nostoxanthinifaciens]UAK26007.1 hypothetical protein K8P63_07820 [Sphingomonas nostoxanthinifaciens]
MLAAFALAVADPVPPTPPAAAAVSAAVQVVRDYYGAIGRHDWRTVHAMFANGHSVAALRRGYADTRSVTVEPLPPFESDAGMSHVWTDIRVRVTALHRDGSRHVYAGSYRLTRVNDVDGSTAAQRRWHITSATLAEVPR